jgi:hypothetical protein
LYFLKNAGIDSGRSKQLAIGNHKSAIGNNSPAARAGTDLTGPSVEGMQRSNCISTALRPFAEGAKGG